MVAVLSAAQRRAGMRETAIDVTIWARFSQPVACAWARDADARSAVVTDVTQAVVNAARWAARLGPKSGTANDYWQQLYQHTYAVELRVERGGSRAQTLLSNGGARSVQMLPMAWRAAGIAFGEQRGVLTQALDAQKRRRSDESRVGSGGVSK